MAELARGPATAWVDKERHLVRQFEGRRFKSHVATGRDLQDEPKIDVDQVPHAVDEDIAIVTVFRLQQEACNGVPARNSHCNDETFGTQQVLARQLRA